MNNKLSKRERRSFEDLLCGYYDRVSEHDWRTLRNKFYGTIDDFDVIFDDYENCELLS